MGKISALILLALILHAQSAPQLLTFKDGKIGVNFGGYHAGIGFGTGGVGGLYAEAGTPHGQSAIAGLGGAVGDRVGSAGGLFAGATAGNGIKASAGLAGGVDNDNSAGIGYASAQAGNNYVATGMGGATSVDGSSKFSFSSNKDVVVPVHAVEIQPINEKVLTEINIDSINEVQPLPKASDVQIEVEKSIKHENVQPVIIKEVHVAPKTQIVEKEIIHTHYKPHRPHVHKTAFLGGYIGAEGDIVGPPAVYKTVEPKIQRRIDVGAESSGTVDVVEEGNINAGVGASHVYTKQVSVQKNPTFFRDIFNIPISALRAVGDFLGNAAANTHVSVQKSAEVQADTDSITSKHAPSSSSSSSSAHISVETPSASKIIDDILAIPINTLGAVNTFLENNVPARKTVQIADDGTVEHSKVRRGARRRANKRVVLVEETPVESKTNQQ